MRIYAYDVLIYKANKRMICGCGCDACDAHRQKLSHGHPYTAFILKLIFKLETTVLILSLEVTALILKLETTALILRLDITIFLTCLTINI